MSNLGAGLGKIDWASANLIVFEKNFYIEDKRVSNRSQAEIDAYRNTHQMRVRLSPANRLSAKLRCQPVVSLMLNPLVSRFSVTPFPSPSPRSTRPVSPTTS